MLISICGPVRSAAQLGGHPPNLYAEMYGKHQGTVKSDIEWRGEWLGEQRMANGAANIE